MREISSDEIYKGLLAYGTFSEKLPPIFSAVDFYHYCVNNNVSFVNKPRQLIQYEAMRNTNVPRLLAVPNPFAYQLLCRCLADNWNKLCTHFETQTLGHTYKVSRIHIRKIIERENIFTIGEYETTETIYGEPTYKDNIFQMSSNNWRIDGNPEIDILIGKRWVVKVDIATCFPSIYTHSLPWALVGKSVAKQNRNGNLWYNKIDKLSQNIKDGETHGIPIGPHASNLLSEIILTVVDKKLFQKWDYFRNIDDYTCYVKSREEAELFITELSEELRQFDLSLNHKKTAILELPIAAIEHWTRQIEHISHYKSGNKLDYKSVRSYLDSAIELMRSNDFNSAILNYAIKVLSNQGMTDNAKVYCIKTILHLAVIYPYLIPLLDKYVFQCYSVDKTLIEKFTLDMFENSLLVKNYETASFCVYFSLKYDFQIPALTVDCGINSEHCIFLIFVYLYSEKYFSDTDKKKLKDYAKYLLSDNIEFERNWLFVYECLSKGLLKDDWKTLKNAGVSFIKFT